MPNCDGLSMTKQIREMANKIDYQIVIIMITAIGKGDHQIKALNFGADYFFEKPLSFSNLNQVFSETYNQRFKSYEEKDGP